MKYSYEQVFQLFIEKLSGNLSSEETANLEKILAEDASFRETWHLLEAEARQLNVNEFLERTSAETGLQALKTQINAADEARLKKSYSIRQVLAVAALFLIVLSGAWLVFFRKAVITEKEQIAAVIEQKKQSVNLVLGNGTSIGLDKTGSNQTIALDNGTLQAANGTLQYTSEDTLQNTLWVPAGESYKIILSDGTEVRLNAETRLRFPFRFTRASREVYVEGEAYFKVAKDTRHPFIVHTPLTQVQVTGTAFNVNTYEPGNVRTALVEGKVTTQSKDGKRVPLEPGLEASYVTDKGFVTGQFDEEEVLSWLNGVYYFHNMPVTELARVASRWYGVTIVLDKDKFAGKSITGLMDKNKLINFLNDLEAVAHTSWYFSGNKLYLK
jgi:transmembrane sensor